MFCLIFSRFLTQVISEGTNKTDEEILTQHKECRTNQETLAFLKFMDFLLPDFDILLNR